MSTVTGTDPFACALIVMTVFTVVTVLAGSTGVLITDTMMAALFTTITMICCLLIARKAGGWFNAVNTIVHTPGMERFLSWQGEPGLIMNNGRDNMIWALTNHPWRPSECYIQRADTIGHRRYATG